MATYNGHVASIVNPGLVGTSFVAVNPAVPGRFFSDGQFGVVVTQGVSGAFGVQVIGAIGGATFAIAGRTNITAVGSFPVPIIAYGVSGSVINLGIPRPYGVEFSKASAQATGFTASVFFAGTY